jgi:glycosyltransferase involved in cell wall biosynthesis
MATWCWEAAHALHELGENVLLVAAPDAALPGTPAFEVMRIDVPKTHAPPQNAFMKTVSTARSHLAAGPNAILERMHKHIAANGVQPTAYILNQSSLVDRRVACPQIVASWSYPVSLFSYLRKTPLLTPNKTIRAFLRTSLSAVGWWRRDWRSYREADQVLPVSNALHISLGRRSVTSHMAYPGTSFSPLPDRGGEGLRLLMAAVQLHEPRKRILWMLDAMKHLSLPAGTVLQLVGEPDESVRQAAGRLGFPVELLGHLKRSDLQKIMRQADIFCFGSLIDDWGYVLVEAMANGMVPVAPAISPFDEIMGDVGSSYRPQSQDDFVCALRSAISVSQSDRRRDAWNRAQRLFSRKAFGSSILRSVEFVTRLR